MGSVNLCVTLTPNTLDEVFSADISRADCVEIRLDYLKNPQESVHTRWDRLPVPVIVTCRGKACGGNFNGSAPEEIRILESAARNGAQFVDIDYRYARAVHPAKVIASYHNFDETPADIAAILDQAISTEAQIAKVATQVNSWADNLKLLELLSRPRVKPTIVIGMGDIGQVTRIVGPARGSFLTYAAAARQAAPGQLSVAEMLDVYKVRRIQSATKLLGILGMPLGHSLSPVFHNRAFEAAKLDFAYVKLPAADLGDFMRSARSVGLAGFSVTIPHKIAVMEYMAQVTPAASEAGAVNTVSASNDQWIGDNTDVRGIEAALQAANFSPKGKTVVIMGRGGAAKAARAALEGASNVRLLGRDEISQAAKLECDLLINATPIGMYPHVEASPVEGRIPAPVVFDMVYNPPTTKLLQTAAAQGKTTISGAAMFVAQAKRQFEIWTGQPAPPEVYEAELVRV